jgi:membrane protein CcdC involved in cytochrome C biogenesis
VDPLYIGIVGAAGLLFLAFKFGMRKVINYDIFFDVVITGILMFSLAGTVSGMTGALIGGLIVSAILYTMKRTMIREQLVVIKEPKQFHKETIYVPKFKWVAVKPDGTRVQL